MSAQEAATEEPTVQIVAGVRLDRVDAAVIRKSLKERGLTAKKPLDAMVRALKGYYQGNYDEDDLFDCPECKGDNIATDAQCPFCGARLEVGDDVVTPPKPKSKKGKEPKSAEIVVTNDDGSVLTEQDLDEAVGSFRRLQSNYVQDMWNMGHALKDMHDRGLWRLRTINGAPAYKSFRQFADAEFGVSHTWAYNAMEVADRFDREQVGELGMSKLGLILKAPDVDRKKLIEEVKQRDMGKRELAEKVRKLREGNRAPATPAPPKKAADKRIVAVPLKLGRTTNKLVKAKPTKDGTHQPAKRLSDAPFCETTVPGFVLTQRVTTDKDGFMVLVTEVARSKE